MAYDEVLDITALVHVELVPRKVPLMKSPPFLTTREARWDPRPAHVHAHVGAYRVGGMANG